MADIALLVGGKRYEGFESIRVTRSIESIAGSFALGVTDRWGALEEPWPILEEDPCRVEIDDQVVIDGYIDARDHSADDKSRSLSYTGRDRSASLVDSSLVLKKWTYQKQTLAEFANTIAKPFGVAVSVQSGITLRKRTKIVISPGDKAYDVLAREAAEEGVILVSDGKGGILITRSSKARATALVEGENIKTAKVTYDGTDRFHRYVVLTQVSVTDDQWQSSTSTRIQAEAIDEGVRRTDRTLLIRPEKGCGREEAQRRADWEMRIRAAKAEQVMVTVQGWTQPDGSLWPLNALTHVEAPGLIGVDGELLISQVDHSIDNSGGVITQLSLVRPDAFTPEPSANKKLKPASYPWGKDFATKGAL